MKTSTKISIYILTLSAMLLAIGLINSTFWTIALPCGIAFIVYIAIELFDTPTMPEDYNE